MNGSPKNDLNVHDIKRILKGAVLASIGAAAAVGAAWVSIEDIDLKHTGIVALAAFLSVVANSCLKFMTDTRAR